jgi:hypothetical protein
MGYFIRQKEPANTNPNLDGYLLKFIKSIKEIGTSQKIDMIYKYVTQKEVPQGMTLDKKLERIIYEQEFREKIKDTAAFLKNNRKQFKLPWAAKSELNKSLKNKDQIVVFFLTVTGEMEMPKMYPIYSGNMVIIRNKPYELDPRSVWRFGKWKCLIIKEIDRRPVSNLDWDEIKKRGDATHSDEFLIKAAMRAIQVGGVKKEMNKWVIIAIAVVVVIALVFFFSQKSSGG